MAKPKQIELPDDTVLPIVYEDRCVLAVDKPRGWMLAPDHWDQTGRNLQLALASAVAHGDYWARSRNIRFIRYIHRLDADTSGLLLLAKSMGVLEALSALFETRQVEKHYLAVVRGRPKQPEWTCTEPIAAVEGAPGFMRVDARRGEPAETHFRVLQTGADRALVQAHPTTGRTHQIRVHLLASGHPVLGDVLYGPERAQVQEGFARLALRATRLAYRDPFQKRVISISAPTEPFLREFGFGPVREETKPRKPAGGSTSPEPKH